MPRAARRYDVYLPLQFNDGRRIPRRRFYDLEQQMLARFRGVTSMQEKFPLSGAWLGESKLYIDQVIVVTALDFRRRGSSRFVARLKRQLIESFQQLEILITETAVRVH
jgi:hypothetical protein